MDALAQVFQGTSWGVVALFVIGCQSITFLAGHMGGAFKPQPWIDDTAKPRFWPPWWFFPFIWIVNYTLMGLTVWHIWQQRDETQVGWILAIFALNLAHNLSFMYIVYRVKKRSFYVLMDSIGLLLASITTALFFTVSPPAGILMLPYLGWMCFTTFIKVLWWRMEHPIADSPSLA